MANTKQIKEVLKELNMTEEQMNKCWQENIDFGYNGTIMLLNKSNLSWKALNPSAIKQLPYQLEKDKIAKKIKEEKRKIEENKELKKTPEEKLLNGLKLEEHEIEQLVNEYEIETNEGDDNRWTRNMQTIIEISNRYFSIWWQKGLTEMQENMYIEQPVEVKRHTYQKTLTVTEWLPC